MNRAIYWTTEAQRSFQEMDEYIESEWGRNVADAFAEDILHTIGLLQIFPNGGVMEVADKAIRSIPVGRHVRLFYRYSEDSVIILELIDTRSRQFQSIRKGS